LPLLLTIGTIIPAYAGVVLAHYYLRGAIRRQPEELVAGTIPGCWTAMVAFLIGVAVAFFIKAGVPALQGLIAAGIAYAILEWVMTARRARSAAVSG
jgi:purine-cytosine permease-like protein